MIEIGFNEDEIKDCFQKMKRKQKTLTCVDNCQKYDILILSGDWNINQLKNIKIVINNPLRCGQ